MSDYKIIDDMEVYDRPEPELPATEAGEDEARTSEELIAANKNPPPD